MREASLPGLPLRAPARSIAMAEADTSTSEESVDMEAASTRSRMMAMSQPGRICVSMSGIRRSQSGPPEGRAGGAAMKMWLSPPFRYAAVPITRAKMNVTSAALPITFSLFTA